MQALPLRGWGGPLDIRKSTQKVFLHDERPIAETSLVMFDVHFWKVKKLKNMNLILFPSPKISTKMNLTLCSLQKTRKPE